MLDVAEEPLHVVVVADNDEADEGLVEFVNDAELEAGADFPMAPGEFFQAESFGQGPLVVEVGNQGLDSANRLFLLGGAEFVELVQEPIRPAQFVGHGAMISVWPSVRRRNRRGQRNA